jgi:hypothetical protein
LRGAARCALHAAQPPPLLIELITMSHVRGLSEMREAKHGRTKQKGQAGRTYHAEAFHFLASGSKNLQLTKAVFSSQAGRKESAVAVIWSDTRLGDATHCICGTK